MVIQLFKPVWFRLVRVRDKEIKEISSHFAPIFRNDHPIHLSLLGKTGTGKTVTMRYFLNILQVLCMTRNRTILEELFDNNKIDLRLGESTNCFNPALLPLTTNAQKALCFS